MLEPLLEPGDILAILPMHDSQNLQKVLLNRVETQRVLVIDECQLLWVLHEIVDDLLTVNVDHLVDLLVGFEVYRVKDSVLCSESIRLTRKFM